MSAPTNSCPQQSSAPALSALCSRSTPHPLTNCGLNSFHPLRLLPEHSARTRAGIGVFPEPARLPGTVWGHLDAPQALVLVVVWTVAEKRGNEGEMAASPRLGAVVGPQGLWSEGLDSVPAALGEGAQLPSTRRHSSPGGGRGGNHTHAGPACACWHTPAQPASGPPPTQPCAHAADVAVVSRPQRRRSLESGHPVPCGYSSRTVGGGQRPL